MSNRSAARGTAAASSMRLTLRTSNAVATSNASPSRCFLFCDGSRAARSARTAAATVSTPPIPAATVSTPPIPKAPPKRRSLRPHQPFRPQEFLMGGKVVAVAAVAPVPSDFDICFMTSAVPTATSELRRLDAYAALPAVDSFARLTDAALYAALPDDWVLGLADIVQSTEAIAQGRYKAVNTAGAAVIAAVANRLGTQQFPFVFGGAGAGFALPGEHEGLARDALASVAAWIRDDLDLKMLVALVPVAAVRAAGHDVRVARYAPSSHVSYAMFTGGGLRFAEAEMKRGAYAVAPGPRGARPDLTGLSCRFAEIQASRGVILSVIAVPGPSGSASAFAALSQALLKLAESGEAGRPIPEEGPEPVWPSAGLELEARAARTGTG